MSVSETFHYSSTFSKLLVKKKLCCHWQVEEAQCENWIIFLPLKFLLTINFENWCYIPKRVLVTVLEHTYMIWRIEKFLNFYTVNGNGKRKLVCIWSNCLSFLRIITLALLVLSSTYFTFLFLDARRRHVCDKISFDKVFFLLFSWNIFSVTFSTTLVCTFLEQTLLFLHL